MPPLFSRRRQHIPRPRRTLLVLKEDQKVELHRERKLKQELAEKGFQAKHVLADLPSSSPPNEQAQGAGAYRRFTQLCNQGKYFNDFRATGRQLGLPLGLIASSRRVEQQINIMHYFMWKNAQKLFPTQTARLLGQTIPHTFDVKTEKGIETRSSYISHDFVNVFALLAEDLSKFLDHWKNVPKFVEEDVSQSAASLLEELEYRVKCIRTSHQLCEEENSQRYLHDLCGIVGPQIYTLGRALSDFVEVGAEAVRSAQEYRRLNLRNMSAIATFFSAVTTGMIQVSIQTKVTLLEKAVNLLFIGSLVMSVAAVIQSLLALAWNQASYRTPDDRAPRLLVLWTMHSPLAFMIASVVMFSVGLVGLCAAVLDPIIFKIVLALSIFCTVGFLITIIWSIAESLVYRHYKGSKWLRDILSARWKRTMGLLSFRIAIKIPDGVFFMVVSIWSAIVDVMVRLEQSVKQFLRHRGRDSALIPLALNSWKTFEAWAVGPSKTVIDTYGPFHLEVVHDDERRAVDLRAEMGIQIEEKEKDAAHFWHQSGDAEGVRLNVIKTHAHVGVIRHLQFNPSTAGEGNRMLATHSKGLTRIWRLSENAPPGPLVHLIGLGTTTGGSVCRQYAWGVDGSRILTRWDATTVVRSVHGDERDFSFSEQWPSDGCTRWLVDGYLSSCGGSIRRLDSTGRAQDMYNIQHMTLIHDMEVTIGRDRIVAVGETLARLNRGARAESAILLYNMDTSNLEAFFPLCRRARTIERSRQIGRSTQHFLVSYEDAPPQLWTLHMDEATPRLSLTRGYAASAPDTMRFTGSACFGGADGFEFVLVPTPRAIYVLSTETGDMHYALRNSVIAGLAAFTSVAWDHSAPSHRLATGSVDGAVIIWTAVPPPPSQAPEDDPAAAPGRIFENALNLSIASPETTPPSSPTPVVKELPGIRATMVPTINIIADTPKLTVPMLDVVAD